MPAVATTGSCQAENCPMGAYRTVDPLETAPLRSGVPHRCFSSCSRGRLRRDHDVTAGGHGDDPGGDVHDPTEHVSVGEHEDRAGAQPAWDASGPVLVSPRSRARRVDGVSGVAEGEQGSIAEVLDDAAVAVEDDRLECSPMFTQDGIGDVVALA